MNAPKKRGFAALTPERRKEIAALGGATAHQMGRAYKFTSEAAKEAGRKGGEATRKRKVVR